MRKSAANATRIRALASSWLAASLFETIHIARRFQRDFAFAQIALYSLSFALLGIAITTATWRNNTQDVSVGERRARCRQRQAGFVLRSRVSEKCAESAVPSARHARRGDTLP